MDISTSSKTKLSAMFQAIDLDSDAFVAAKYFDYERMVSDFLSKGTHTYEQLSMALLDYRRTRFNEDIDLAQTRLHAPVKAAFFRYRNDLLENRSSSVPNKLKRTELLALNNVFSQCFGAF